MNPSHACALCGTSEDIDEFVVVHDRHLLCRNCRTCPHGHIHYEDGRADVCYQCVRAYFSVETFWGALVPDIDEYVAYAHETGLKPELLVGNSWEETEMVQARAAEGWKPLGVEVRSDFPPPWHRGGATS